MTAYKKQILISMSVVVVLWAMALAFRFYVRKPVQKFRNHIVKTNYKNHASLIIGGNGDDFETFPIEYFGILPDGLCYSARATKVIDSLQSIPNRRFTLILTGQYRFKSANLINADKLGFKFVGTGVAIDTRCNHIPGYCR